MADDPKSRVDTSVPKPDLASQLSEEEKQALELEGQIEHLSGTQREQAAEKADDLAGGEANPK